MRVHRRPTWRVSPTRPAGGSRLLPLNSLIGPTHRLLSSAKGADLKVVLTLHQYLCCGDCWEDATVVRQTDSLYQGTYSNRRIGQHALLGNISRYMSYPGYPHRECLCEGINGHLSIEVTGLLLLQNQPLKQQCLSSSLRKRCLTYGWN